MIHLFDTNIVLIYLRDLPAKQIIESVYNPFSSENRTVISVVTVGELKAIALKNKWGVLKIEKLEAFILKCIVADINLKDTINRYAEIDAFSQGRLDSKKSNFTARNMGKNDLWIAATASLLNLQMITTDNDFDHLENSYLPLQKVTARQIKKHFGL